MQHTIPIELKITSMALALAVTCATLDNKLLDEQTTITQTEQQDAKQPRIAIKLYKKEGTSS